MQPAALFARCMQQVMDSGMIWGDLGGLIGLILLVLIIAAFVQNVFRR